ncbi:MAG: hypothetical protein LBO09_07100 [Candidatus Peribacteria bacterium]|jgi:hypothetical protein|nr:hypothetical protein [Candidatus Peribacteria bacterium]
MNVAKLFNIAIQFGIADTFVYLVVHNEGNCNPYHNLNHHFSVFEACYQISEKCRKNGKTISKQEQIILLEASLFHDFFHSAGKLSDDINVSNSCSEYQSFRENRSKRPYSEEEVAKVCSLIKTTEFPFIKQDCELSLVEKILRDADVVQSVRGDFLAHSIGLGKEWNKPSVVEWLENTVKFNSGGFILPETNELYLTERQANVSFFAHLISVYKDTINSNG